MARGKDSRSAKFRTIATRTSLGHFKACIFRHLIPIVASGCVCFDFTEVEVPSEVGWSVLPVLTQSGSPKLWWRRRQARGCACTNWILRLSPFGLSADMASVAVISSSRNRMRASDGCQLICSIPWDTHLAIGELSYPCILLFCHLISPSRENHLHSFRARTRHAQFTPNSTRSSGLYLSQHGASATSQLTVRRQQPRIHTAPSVQRPSLSFKPTILRLSPFVILL